MTADEEDKFFDAVERATVMFVGQGAVAAFPTNDGGFQLGLMLLTVDGKDIRVPLDRAFALRLGEALMRAVDAFDEGLVAPPNVNDEADGGIGLMKPSGG